MALVFHHKDMALGGLYFVTVATTQTHAQNITQNTYTKNEEDN